MKKNNIAVFMLAVSVSMAGCSSNTERQNVVLGTAVGAVAGGVAGSAIGQGVGRLVAVGAGAVVGGMIGGSVGQSMDSSDKQKTYAVVQANSTNQTTSWKNETSGTTYAVTPTSDMTKTSTQECRHYKMTAKMQDKVTHVTGVACRQTDGTWETR
jgi:surface antigen